MHQYIKISCYCAGRQINDFIIIIIIIKPDIHIPDIRSLGGRLGFYLKIEVIFGFAVYHMHVYAIQ